MKRWWVAVVGITVLCCTVLYCTGVSFLCEKGWFSVVVCLSSIMRGVGLRLGLSSLALWAMPEGGYGVGILVLSG